MDYITVHKRWDEYWKKHGTNRFDPASKKPKYYCLQMFPYPSGANLHLGHYFNYAVSDTHARFKRMSGFNVFQPFGFDAFGLPAENYALKTKTHPRANTLKNIEIMKSQIDELGHMHDWNYSVTTCFPDYYKWTQWLFAELFKAGLAYQKDAPVNWCDKCKTVLANEQVLGGHCERCDTVVIRKQMKQWFFRITDFAEQLLDGLNSIDWPEKTKTMQRNWIGKSVGANVSFGEISVFTTRIDTIFGVTFLAIAPEHTLANKLITANQKKQCADYVAAAAKKSDIERLGSDGEKTGAFTGSYVINPANGVQVPVYITDYVLATYGTGAVMGVPAHDERDFAFAKKYNLPIKEVVCPEVKSPRKREASDLNTAFCEDGILVNSGNYNGLKSTEARRQMTAGFGKTQTTYRLRDWGIGRQRYWGCPIPIVYCDKCGTVAETRLPVLLPEIDDFAPKGAAPLANHPEFYNCTCPVCGGAAKRECDTMDTFVCSSWYFLRYPDANNPREAFNKKTAAHFLPVDKYIGGAEHACMHLLYARFITMFLHDKGYVNFTEPFRSLIHQGMILGSDGAKMSKNKGNTRNPDTYTDKYGSDILRLFMLFGFNYTEGGPWNDDAVKSVIRFTDRIENLIKSQTTETKPVDKELLYIQHSTIKSVRADLENFSFNTAVARCMELLNAIIKSSGDTRGALKTLILLTAPMIPHIAEEFWTMLSGKPSIFDQPFPEADEYFLTRDTVEIAVQINSKIITRINIPSRAEQKEVEDICLKDEKVKNTLANNNTEPKKIKKVIYIKNKLINFLLS